MRGSATPTVSDATWIRRFGRTERAVHWVHAAAFFALLVTGLVLLVPDLSVLVARRNLVKNVHLFAAVAWAVLLVAIVVLGDRRRLAADWREAERIDADDRRWLRGRRVPQGKFNAGQKLNLLLTAALAVVFTISGFFLWLGERDHTFLLDGAGTVHDVATYASILLVAGHLYLAVIHPTTRHALHGMIGGDVREDWAERHHAKWVAAERDRAE